MYLLQLFRTDTFKITVHYALSNHHYHVKHEHDENLKRIYPHALGRGKYI